jgi:hypothetical protein
MRPSFPVVDPYECTVRRNTFVLGELDETYRNCSRKMRPTIGVGFVPGSKSVDTDTSGNSGSEKTTDRDSQSEANSDLAGTSVNED